MENKETPPADQPPPKSGGKSVAEERAAARAAEEAATQAAAKAKITAFFNKLFPPESSLRKFAPLIIITVAITVLVLAKCGVSAASDKIAAVSQARAEAVRVRTTGVLTVKSNRPGATVEVTRVASADDTSTAGAKGNTDQALSGLAPGKYTITAHADGWPDAQGEASVTAGQQTEATVNFKSGSLRLVSDPAGAVVELAGATLGKTPLTVPQLPLGECKVTLTYPGWPVMALKTVIKENAETAETVRLPHGKLTVESFPAGASVLLGGRSFGQTPLFFDPFPAGPAKLTLQAKDFPPLEVAVTVDDRGDVKVSRELGYAYPELDPVALLGDVWLPDDPNRLSVPADSLGRYEPHNGIVKNLKRKLLYERWLYRSYHYSGTIKTFDKENGKIEFVEQTSEYSKYRVLTKLSSTALNDKDLIARLTAKGATFTFYGRLESVEEPRWPFKVITFELSSAEPLH